MQGVDGIEFITFDKNRPAASLLAIRRQLRGRRSPILLAMHASMRANLAGLMVGAERRIGFDRRRARDFQWLFTSEKIAARPGEHVMDGLFGFIEHLGVRERVIRWDIPVSDADRAFAAEVCGAGAPVCVVSPCSSQRFRNYRNWRAENYTAVVSHLQKQCGARVILTGGRTAVETQYGAAIGGAAAKPVTNLIGRTSLKELLAVLDRADLLICPDSGPAHMATAVGTPVIGLYATSNRHRTGPYYSQHLVVDRYPEAVAREFSTTPEALRWGQRVRDPDAMDLIGVAEVIHMAETVLAGPGVAATSADSGKY